MAIAAEPGAAFTTEGVAYLVGQSFPVQLEGCPEVMVTVLEAEPHPHHPMAAALVLVESVGPLPIPLRPSYRHPELN